jgi:hypothetical protein
MKPIRSRKSTSAAASFFAGGIILMIVVAFFFWLQAPAIPVVQELKLSDALVAPTSLLRSGFYRDPVRVVLHCNEGEQIYYTLDGSQPDPKSALYTGPFEIGDVSSSEDRYSQIPTSPRWKPPLNRVYKGTVIRAVCVNNERKSTELQRTIFIARNPPYSLPVVSIICTPDDLFGFSNGIYVMGKRYENKDFYLRKDVRLDAPWWEYPGNYLKRGKEGQRDAGFEYIESDGTVLQQHAQIGINGNATRGFPQKSLRVKFAETPGRSLFSSGQKSRTIILRNSGNDWSRTMFRDALMKSLLTGFNVDKQEHKHVQVFINGEYWGIHDMCDRLDAERLARLHSVPEDSIVIIESDQLSEGPKKGLREFKQLIKFFKTTDLSSQSGYLKAQQLIDVSSFMDFLIANIYFANSDWPNNNVKCWKTTGDSTARWRWMVYDLDWGFGGSDPQAYNMNLLPKATQVGSVGVIFTALLQNRDFRQEFLHRYEGYMKKNFAPAGVETRISSFEQLLQGEMPEHISRWRAIGSMEQWRENVDELRTFAIKRPAIQMQQLYSFMQAIEKKNNSTVRK